MDRRYRAKYLKSYLIQTLLLLFGVHCAAMIFCASIIGQNVSDKNITTYYVKPLTGIIGLLGYLLIKTLYDIKFEKMNKDLTKKKDKKMKTMLWILYVVMMIPFYIISFFAMTSYYSKDIYTFGEVLLQRLHTFLVLFLVPCGYMCICIIKIILKNVIKKIKIDKNKKS